MKFLLKIPKHLTNREKKLLYMALFFSLIGAFLEMLGISLILPFVAILFKNQIVTDMNFLNININDIVKFFESVSPFLPFILIIILFLLKNLILFAFSWFNSHLINTLGSRLSNNVYQKYLNKDYKFHINNNTSNLTFHSVEVADRYKDTIGHTFTIISEILVIFFLSCLMLFMEPKGFLISLVFITILSYLAFSLIKNSSMRWGKKVQNLDKQRFLELSHGYGGIKEIKIFKRINYFLNKYFSITSERFRAMFFINVMSNLPRFLIETFFVFSLVVFIIYLKLSGKPDSEIFLILSLFGISSIRLMPSFNRILSSLQKVKYGQVYVETIDKIFSSEDNIINMKDFNQQNKQNENKIISFKNVYFEYPGKDKLTLQNINLNIFNKDFVGIVGKTGSGKSTLINLLLGLHKPSSGKIETFYKNVGYVPQSIFLMDDTIINNVAYGIEENKIDMNLVEECIRKSQLKEFTDKLPDGLRTIVGEKGVRISGGELQRLGIARALYHNPDLLVFDEATNALDEKTELVLVDLVKELSRNITVIAISHNVKSLKYCSRILRIENSIIIEEKNQTKKVGVES